MLNYYYINIIIFDSFRHSLHCFHTAGRVAVSAVCPDQQGCASFVQQHYKFNMFTNEKNVSWSDPELWKDQFDQTQEKTTQPNTEQTLSLTVFSQLFLWLVTQTGFQSSNPFCTGSLFEVST